MAVFLRFRCIPFPRSQRGFVIVFVLGMVFLASLLLTAFIERSGVELAAETKAAQRVFLREEAYAVLEWAQAALADQAALHAGLHSPAEGWGRPLEIYDYAAPPGIKVDVVVADETGKLPLAVVDDATLRLFLGVLGLAATDADELSDALLTWTRADHASLYRELDDAYSHPPGRPLRTFDELRCLPAARRCLLDKDGRWNELGRRFCAEASLYEFDRINANTASGMVFRSLGLSVPDAAFEGQPKGPQGKVDARPIYTTADDIRSVFGSSPAALRLRAQANCVRVTVLTRSGSRGFRLEAVIDLGADPVKSPVHSAAADPQRASPRPWTALGSRSGLRFLEITESDTHGS
ncbi:MAG: general secretion pathway protein GspK [Opitutae bacterium]|nr:general secretion pathway protein GspK [Opitutae bacterium]